MAAVPAAALSPPRRRIAGWLWLWGPVAVYMAAIFTVSGQSTPPLPPSISDKLLHALSYSGLAVLALRAVAGGLPARVTAARAAAALAVAIGYGATDELHQTFVPGRSAELLDLYADAIGAAAGMSACWLWGIIRPSDSQLPPSNAPS